MLYAAIYVYNNARVRKRMNKTSVSGFKKSSWRNLYKYADDASFLDVTGFTKDSFNYLVNYLRNHDDRRHKGDSGRPWSMNYHGRVGLLILYLGSTMLLKQLSLIFGIVPSVLERNIDYMLNHVCRFLPLHQNSMIKFPNNADCIRFSNLVKYRYPVNDVIGFMDGLSVPVKCSSDSVTQAAYYNGWKSDTMCNNVMLFSPEGKVIAACINYPGSMHDSDVSRRLCSKIVENLFNW
jgi:hypothetical protein